MILIKYFSTRLFSKLSISGLMIATSLSIANCASSPKGPETRPETRPETGSERGSERESGASPQTQTAPLAQTPQQQAASRLQVEKDHFVSDTQRRMGVMKDYENSLRTRAAADTTPQSKKMQNAADDLSTLLKSADSSLDEVKSANAENWVNYRRDVDRHMGRASSMFSISQSLFQ